jgi:hypothetical protein
VAALFIIHHAGLAPCRWCPLNSHVRQRWEAVQGASMVSACRRELNSHEAAKPQGKAPSCEGLQGVRSYSHVEAELLHKHAGRGSRGEPGELKVSLWSSRRASNCGGLQRGTRRLRSPGQRQKLGACSAVARGALPNPSFKRTANGASPWPRGRVVYHRPRGQGATPLAAA